MKLPKKVRVGYIDYKVREMPAHVKFEGDHYVHKSTIRVKSKNRPARAALNTLLHEIAHAIFYAHGIDEVKSFTEDMQELAVNSFANGLSQVLRDNPELRKLLRHAR